MILGEICIVIIFASAVTIIVMMGGDDYVSRPFIITFLIAVILLICTIVCSFIPNLQPKTITAEQEIVSIQDDSQINGRFSMFGGTLNEDYYFGYYYKNGNGYKLAKVKAYNTTIVETNEISPKIVTIKKDSNFWQLLFLWNFDCYSEENIIYVPIGTIIKDFNLNGG